MLSETEIIDKDLNIPNHEEELLKAEEVIKRLKEKMTIMKIQKILEDNQYMSFYNEIIRVLEYVGKLSIPAFNIEEKLKDKYTLQYVHSPQLGKKLWLDHYESIHHPYNLLKNRCYVLLDKLDALYKKCNKKNPPTWDTCLSI